ncbi:glycoside hydrolase family 18 protein [Peribacillus kribbensis]|uniref:glycoside hydrolase family 18 protein n=1 Tax=Peribacillus kribbensis TaxID=356658 RepID=UPI00041BB609|nr:glycoside hydrolase family 18 protein [Peribacillus kribbensis]
MFIHIVKKGDTLYSISRRYRASLEQLRNVNGLEGEVVVPGQALLLPLYTYVVQPGDTLTRIAKKAFVTMEQLRRANPGITSQVLQAGSSISIPDISNYLAATLGFYVIRSPELDVQLVNDFAPYSSLISMFEYHITGAGGIANNLNDKAAIEATWKNRVTPLATITNLSYGGFSPELAGTVLNNPAARRNLVDNIYNLLKRKGYGGVNIDFERVRAQDRDLFTGFLRQLRDRLNPEKLALTIAVPAKTSEEISWLRGYDYGGIGSVVNYMFIMAYDWHHSGSEPGPVAPITEVRRTIEFAIRTVPRRKIIIGVPLYGYNWSIPYRPGTVASAISNQGAIETALRHEAPIQYSEEYQSPFFRYTDQAGQTHEVWFEDVRSMSEKIRMVRAYGLQGIGAWQLTLGFPQGVWLLRKFFRIRKV